VIEESGWMRYAYRHDVDASVETRLWLNRQAARQTLAVAVGGALLGVLAAIVQSWWLAVVAVAVVVGDVGYHLLRIRRTKARFRAMHGIDAEVAFSTSGVWSRDLGEATFPWSFFTGWTIRRGAIIVLRQVKPQGTFLRLPISAVPDDEWQPLTNLLWERLGPASKPDAVRRYHEPTGAIAIEG
jgi:hypothetical protein